MSAQTPQAHPAERSLASLKLVLSDEIQELERIGCIMRSLCDNPEWFEEDVATGPYLTLASIIDNLKTSRDHITQAWKKS